ncbi:helix-turn-helix transcriptional regulator [Streptomyces sp. NPDC001380]|uniref:helix-turn-helix transcriptional regulator n=1 Tax=Streptomyces sp. NPDC001380 TaxID=3364566 RepID=UPI0036C2428F
MVDGTEPPRSSPQTLWSEENLAERVRLEREARGWSTGALADRLTQAGYPMNQSAVWRIESGTPRRRINLEEAIGFSEVFGLSLEDLLSPPRLAMHARVRELIEDVRRRQREYLQAGAAFIAARDALDAYLDRHPEVREEAEGAIAQAMAEDAAAGRYPGPVLMSLEPDEPDEPEEGGRTYPEG